MLVETAIADAYGGGFESSELDFVELNNHLQYVSHHKYPTVVPMGHYTDDTQMTLAIVEAMVEKDEWTPLNLANRFVQCFKRDERRGYAGRFFHFLMDVNDGQEFLDNINPESERSGAAMRSSPLGLLSDIDEIKDKCYIQANLTHNTEAGRYTSFASALMVYYFKNDIGPQAELSKWLAAKLNVPQMAKPWREERVSTLGWHCVLAAMTAAMEEKTLADVLKRSVSFTGDVDTVATIAVSAAYWSKDILKNLPQHLYDGLENGKYGRDYLENLNTRLDKTWKT